jgi:hypothetical protein
MLPDTVFEQIQLVAGRAEEITKDFLHFEFPNLMLSSLKR